MQKLAFILIGMLFYVGAVQAMDLAKDNAKDSDLEKKFSLVPDMAQYSKADWDNEVLSMSNLTREKAMEVALEDPKISYFFYTKGLRMVLEMKDGSLRFFNHGDVVFFSGEPWWGTAPGLADGYTKK